MTSAQIAADVAARYGMPVMAGAVKVCPPATYSWQIEGKDDKPPTWEEMQKTFYKNRARVHRITKAPTPKILDLSADIVRMYQSGSTITEISTALKTSLKNVRNKLKAAGVYDPARSRQATIDAARISNKARGAANNASRAARVAKTQQCRSTGENVGVHGYHKGSQA